MSEFLNLALFVGVFYLIIVCAGRRDRRTDRRDALSTAHPHAEEKRIA
jgi:hypothetical protein